MININKMHPYQRKDFLDCVIWHLEDNNFYTFEDADHRTLETNNLKVTWYSGSGHVISIKSKLTNTEFELRVSVGCYDFEDQFVYKIGELFDMGSEWTAMKDEKFHKEFFGLKDSKY